MVAALLLTEDAGCEVLHQLCPADGTGNEVLHDVLGEAPILEVALTPRTTKLLWSTANYEGKKVNELATALASGQHTIKGDALLVLPPCNGHTKESVEFLFSHLLRQAHVLRPAWPLQPLLGLSKGLQGSMQSAAALAGRQTCPAGKEEQPAAAATTAATTLSQTDSTPRQLDASTPVSIPTTETQGRAQSILAPPKDAQPESAACGSGTHITHPSSDQPGHLAQEPSMLAQGEAGSTQPQLAHQPSCSLYLSASVAELTAASPAAGMGSGPAGTGKADCEQMDNPSMPRVTTVEVGAAAVVAAAVPAVAAVEAPSQTAPPGVAASPAWAELPAGVISQICMALIHDGVAAHGVLNLTHVCRTWRDTVLGDHMLLSALWFKLDPHRPFADQQAAPGASGSAAQLGTVRPSRHPRVRRMLPLSTRLSACLLLNDALQQQEQEHAEKEAGEHASAGLASEGNVRAPAGHLHSFAEQAAAERAAEHLACCLPHLPRLLVLAAKHGNPSALAAHAQLLEVCGKSEDALKLWKKCAKAGDPEGMLRLGLAAYQGSASHVVDVDAAHQWLSKAVKALLGINNLSTVSVDLTRERVFLWRANKESSKPMPSIVCLHISDLWRYRRQECQEELLSQQGEVANTGAKSEGPQAAGEPRQQQELRPRLVQNGAVQSSGQTPSVSCRALLSQRAQAYVSAGHLAIAYTDEATLSAALGRAAMILAYMAFDGEGMRADKEQACNLFKLAAVCGCREAARVLGWLFSTGQYGF